MEYVTFNEVTRELSKLMNEYERLTGEEMPTRYKENGF